jgi:hypothetical protein
VVADDTTESAVGARPEVNSAETDNPAVEPHRRREAAIEAKMQGAAAILALQQKRSLSDLLSALISVRRQHGIGEKDLRALLAAKPDFDHVELRDLIEGLDDLAAAWITHEHHNSNLNGAVSPADNLVGDGVGREP